MKNDENELRDALFPDGKPEPDEFIAALAELARQIKEYKEEAKS